MIKYTYEDYKKLPSLDVAGLVWELIDGVIQFAAAPASIHQKLLGELHFYIRLRLESEKDKCQIMIAPSDVYLKKSIVLQPDLFIVRDKEQITKSRCNGIPDLIVEILSPGTKEKDLPNGSKFRIYEEFLLREYWIVDPLDENNITLTQYVLENDVLKQKQVYTKEGKIQSHIYSWLEIDLSEIFSLDD